MGQSKVWRKEGQMPGRKVMEKSLQIINRLLKTIMQVSKGIYPIPFTLSAADRPPAEGHLFVRKTDGHRRYAKVIG